MPVCSCTYARMRACSYNIWVPGENLHEYRPPILKCVHSLWTVFRLLSRRKRGVTRNRDNFASGRGRVQVRDERNSWRTHAVSIRHLQRRRRRNTADMTRARAKLSPLRDLWSRWWNEATFPPQWFGLTWLRLRREFNFKIEVCMRALCRARCRFYFRSRRLRRALYRARIREILN